MVVMVALHWDCAARLSSLQAYCSISQMADTGACGGMTPIDVFLLVSGEQKPRPSQECSSAHRRYTASTINSPSVASGDVLFVDD